MKHFFIFTHLEYNTLVILRNLVKSIDMNFWAILWIKLSVLTVLSFHYEVCLICDCTVAVESSIEKIVKTIHVAPVCTEGRLRWYVHNGGLGIIFQPIQCSDYALCFSIDSENVRVQVYEELEQKTLYPSFLSGPPNLKRVVSVDNRILEICLYKSSTENIKLFLEPERTFKSIGFGFVDMKFTMTYNIDHGEGDGVGGN